MYIVTGILQNLHDNTADFGWAPFMKSNSRSQFADFLPTMAVYYPAIFIPNKANFEDVDWQLFFRSLSIELWITLIFAAFLSAIIIHFMEWIILNTKPVSEVLSKSIFKV